MPGTMARCAIVVLALSSLCIAAEYEIGRTVVQPIKLTVGAPESDLPGFTNQQIQCAIDRVAFLGGGVVELSEGTFKLADSVHLRSRVRLTGQGEKSVLLKNPMKSARVVAYLGYGLNAILFT
jgi:hypothetical protein